MTPHPVELGEHDAVILRMHANNVSTKRIGNSLKCSGDLVMDRIKVLRATGIIVRKSPPKLTRVTAGECDEALKQMRRAGRTNAEIGRALNCSDRVVVRRFSILRAAGELEDSKTKRQVETPDLLIKRTPQLDALFVRAFNGGVQETRMQELFRCDAAELQAWKRALGLGWRSEPGQIMSFPAE